MKVTIVGATGLIGRRLTAALTARGDAVLALSRSGDEVAGAQAMTWDPARAPMPIAAVEGADALVNLAGAPIADGRWTDERRRRLRQSRVMTTARIVAALSADKGPRTLVSASAVGYYGGRGEERLEETAEPGDGFLPDLCREWEAAALAAEIHGVRTVLLRTGVVLAREGGALPRLVTPTKLLLGGPLGGGRQWVPWIHADDEVGLILHALDSEWVRGPLNGSAPEPVRQRDLARAVGRAVGRPAVTPTPGLALRLLFGDMAQVLLEGQRAVPAAALAQGYRFRHEDLDEALLVELGGLGPRKDR